MKKTVDAFDYAGHIMKAMSKGILLTTACGDEVNTMTIGWGAMCVEWNKPIFIAYVRESRYTKEMLEKNGEFTVNIPINGCDSKILGYCGRMSGRDVNKIKELGLSLEGGENVSVPGIKELPLTLECKVIYQQEQPIDPIPEDAKKIFYPHGDAHTAYYGEIVNAYLIEE